MRVGLVLGGGGAVGLAYHAGALAALEHELEWDPRTADVIVGTSAGSMIATLLRRGLSAGDLAAVAVEARPLAMTADVEAMLAARPQFDPVSLSKWILRRPRVPAPNQLLRLARRPWTFDVVQAFASWVPDGLVDMNESGTDVAALFGTDWPPNDLRIVVVQREDLRRVVFGSDLRPPAWQAVAASCAIPSFFKPVTIDGVTYLDGGVRSPTNADVLANERLDLVIVLSPMSARGQRGFRYQPLMRRHASVRLRREVAKLRAMGTETVTVEPGAEVTRLAGFNFMSGERVHEIVRTTYFDTADLLHSAPTAAALAPLSARARRRSDELDEPVGG